MTTHRIIVIAGSLVLEDTGNRAWGAAKTREWVREAREVYGESDPAGRVEIEIRSATFVASWD